MRCDTEKHRRRSIRLNGYNYSLPGAYFVTICVNKRKCILGGLRDGYIAPSAVGEIVHRCWNEIPEHFKYTELDAFVLMPNHLHGIIIITNCRGVQLNAPTPKTPTTNFYKTITPKRNTLSVIIRTFKAAVTTCCRERNLSFQWQRNYYEHIIRNNDELNRIREYIVNNPEQWKFDRENPKRIIARAYNNRWGNIEKVIYGT